MDQTVALYITFGLAGCFVLYLAGLAITASVRGERIQPYLISTPAFLTFGLIVFLRTLSEDIWWLKLVLALYIFAFLGIAVITVAPQLPTSFQPSQYRGDLIKAFSFTAIFNVYAALSEPFEALYHYNPVREMLAPWQLDAWLIVSILVDLYFCTFAYLWLPRVIRRIRYLHRTGMLYA